MKLDLRKPPTGRQKKHAPLEGPNTEKMDAPLKGPNTEKTGAQKSVETSQQKSPTGTVEQKQIKRGIKAKITEKIQRNKPLPQRKYLLPRPLPSMATKLLEGPEIGENVKVAFKATLKTKDTESVIQVEIASKDYAIKPHTRDGEANIVNTAILRTLDIPNLTATSCRILSEDEAKTIAKKLPNTTLREMSRQPYQPDGDITYVDQISEYVAGATHIDQLTPLQQVNRDKETSLLTTYGYTTDFKVAIATAALTDKDVKVTKLIALGEDPEIAYDARVKIGEEISAKDQETYKTEKRKYDHARVAGQLTKDEWEQAKEELDSPDETVRDLAADRINKAVSLTNVGKQYKSAITLAEQGPDAVSKQLAVLDTKTSHYNTLRQQLAQPGSDIQKAMVALATVDLILGMKDHFYTGGVANNFVFDGTKIIGIDNAKTFNQKLDLAGGLEASKAWRDNSPTPKDTNSLANYIEKSLNKLLQDALPHNTPPPEISSELISAVVSDTLERLAQVCGDKALNPDISEQLKYRLQYITKPIRQSSTQIRGEI